MTLFFIALLACGGKAPESTEPAEGAATEAPATDGASASEVDPGSACDSSVCGKVVDAGGKPIANATLLVVRNDDVIEDPSPLEAGEFLFHIREENSGPPPWKLTFAADGYVSKTIDVPDPLPDSGKEYTVTLDKAP